MTSVRLDCTGARQDGQSMSLAMMALCTCQKPGATLVVQSRYAASFSNLPDLLSSLQNHDVTGVA